MNSIGSAVAASTSFEELRQCTREGLTRIERLSTQLNQPSTALCCQNELGRLAAPAAATVLLIGDINTGKSSLANALVGVPDLLPVDIDVSTGSYIRLYYGTTTAAQVFSADGAEGQTIAVDDIADWVCVGAQPDGRPVRFAELSLPSELLASGLELIDTPGLGGLDPIHAELTMSLLPQADALLYVLDALAPLGQRDVDFLRMAGTYVPIVCLVVNKADLTGGLEDLKRENETVLMHHLPELARSPMMVSARVATAVLRRGGDLDPITDRSGVGALRQLIVGDVAARADYARLHAGEVVLSAAAEELANILGNLISASESARDRQAQLLDAQREISRLREAASALEDDLRTMVKVHERDFNNALQDKASDLRRELDRDIDDNWRRERLAGYADVLRAGLVSAAITITASAREALLTDLGDYAKRLGVVHLEASVAREGSVWTAAPSTRQPQLTAGKLDRNTKSRLARQLLFSPTGMRSASTVLGAGLGAVISGGILAPVMIAASLGFVAFDFQAATSASQQREARRHLAEVLPRWQRDLRQALEDEHWATFKEIRARLSEALALRIGEVERRIVTLEDRAASELDDATLAYMRAMVAELEQVMAASSARREHCEGRLKASAATR